MRHLLFVKELNLGQVFSCSEILVATLRIDGVYTFVRQVTVLLHVVATAQLANALFPPGLLLEHIVDGVVELSDAVLTE